MAKRTPRLTDSAVGLLMLVGGVVSAIVMWATSEIAPCIFEDVRVGSIWAASIGVMLAMGAFRLIVGIFSRND